MNNVRKLLGEALAIFSGIAIMHATKNTALGFGVFFALMSIGSFIEAKKW